MATQPRKHRQGRLRPLLELLEDRTAPAVFMVNSLLDGPPTVDGQLTLREALTAANSNAPSGDAPAGQASQDTIQFAPILNGGTIHPIDNHVSAGASFVLTTYLGSGDNSADVQFEGLT